MFESMREHWIVSEERKQLEDGIAKALSATLRGALPLIPRAIIDASVALVMSKVDQMIAQPVKLKAAVINVNDHR